MAARKGDITCDEFLTQETAQGLRITIQSTIELCRYFIEKFQFENLLTGKVNQDNLEKFFGTIRQAAGCNDHPSCPTFLQLYKLLSVYSIIKPPKYGNCTVSDETSPQILVSLSKLKAAYGGNSETKSLKYRREIQRRLDATLEHKDWEVDDIIEYQPDHDNIPSPTLDCIIYYVTGFSH
ncbi:PREDICTED: uncharacterized protein LOC105566272 [Vollenhovia emeryi]|uniref:uncharacterized protein LOC105566272 n=1 Tax=Vollenhovia emeryi TaxID=411798 RepID=UPI0005F40504|nr:PREDICTED: uncharacterized protein LOC105566272 [Vollenhovia emeryi]